MATNGKHTGVAVLGGGPGGYGAAFMAADLDLDVTLVDVDPNPGGTCLYRGCIPSKALLHVAKVIAEAEDAKAWGVTFNKPKIDLDQLREKTQAVVTKLTGGLGQLANARKVTMVQGRGSFLDSDTLRVHQEHDEFDLSFDKAVVATGSRPAVPDEFLLDSERIMTSTDALELPDLPDSLLVVGGGYIGLELGSVYATLGSKVTVVEMTDGLLPGADRDLVRPLQKRLEGLLHAIHLETRVSKATETKKGIEVELTNNAGESRNETFDKLLISVGRKPNSSGLGLNKTKAQIDEGGFVRVDEQRRTDDPSIFAIGDVAGQPMLAHKATHEGIIAVEVIAGQSAVYEPRAVPAVVFTDPEIAWCGLTENQAKEAGRKVTVGRFPWGASGRAGTLNRSDGVTKVLADPTTNVVVGVGICGPGAGELIAEGVLAVEMGALASDLKLSIHPHPTLSETVMEAAEQIFGRSTHYLRPRRK